MLRGSVTVKHVGDDAFWVRRFIEDGTDRPRSENLVPHEALSESEMVETVRRYAEERRVAFNLDETVAGILRRQGFVVRLSA